MTGGDLVLLVLVVLVGNGMFWLGTRLPYFTERQREREEARVLRQANREARYEHERQMLAEQAELEKIRDQERAARKKELAEQMEARKARRIEDTIRSMYPGFSNRERHPSHGDLGPVPMSPGEVELERAQKNVRRLSEMEEEG